MKITFFTEMSFEGKISRGHDKMRTEFAWMVALNSDHNSIGNLPNLSDKQYDLVYGYTPLEVNTPEQKVQDFVSNIKNTIPQCSLCPVEFDTYEISASTKKPKIKKNDKV